MRSIYLFAVLLFMAAAAWPQTDSAIRQKFRSKDYTVTWGAVPVYPKAAGLVIGDGNGHGGTLRWLRFQPGKDAVEITSIEFDEGWHPNKSKWSPDLAPVTVKKGEMSQQSYAALLHRIAVASSARLKSVSRDEVTMSSGDFWVAARLTFRSRQLLDLNWAGYPSTMREVEYIKPEMVVDLARAAVAELELKEAQLSVADRSWASDKFIYDWNELSKREYYWWVAERMIIIAGVVGNETVLPTLAGVINRDVTGGSEDRLIYYAINAVTRVTGKDVRPRPVEEMDLETTQRKVLEMLAAR